MPSYRPAFRVPPAYGQSRPGAAANLLPQRTNSRHRHHHRFSQMSPVMRLITKSRDINQSGQAMVTLNQMNRQNVPHERESHPASKDPIKEKLKPENFEDFASRMNSATHDGALGPDMHAAMLCIANGIDILDGNLEERRGQLQMKLLQGASGISKVEKEGESSDKGNAIEEGNRREESGPSDPDSSGNKNDDSIVSTFGTGVGRMSLKDLEQFQKRNKMWKATLRSTLNYIRRNRPSDEKIDHSAWNSRQGTEGSRLDPSSSEDQGSSSDSNLGSKAAKVVAARDMDRVLQRGSLLVLASSSLKLKSMEKQVEAKVPIQYTPPSNSYLEKAMEKLLKLPIYEKIESNRKKAMKEGFAFDAVEDDIAGAVKNVARELQSSYGTIGTSAHSFSTDKTTRPFDWVKDSSIPGNKDQSAANSLPLKIIQGLQDGELSSFLENYARRNPGLKMDFVPADNKPGGSQSHRSQKESIIPQEQRKFGNLPLPVLSRVAEELKTSGERIKGFPNIGYTLKLNSKMNSFAPEKNNPQLGSKNPGLESLKKLSFQDVTKSEFAREMRKHQAEFPVRKSKDEMRKSFPETYILPRGAKH